MGIGRKAGFIPQLVAKIQQMIVGEAAFEKGTGVDAGGGMALKIDKIASFGAVAPAEKMIKRNFGDGGKRRVGRNVAANIGIVFVGAHHHGGGVPANNA